MKMFMKMKTRTAKTYAYRMLLNFKTSVTYIFLTSTDNCVRCEAPFVGPVPQSDIKFFLASMKDSYAVLLLLLKNIVRLSRKQSSICQDTVLILLALLNLRSVTVVSWEFCENPLKLFCWNKWQRCIKSLQKYLRWSILWK